MQPHGKKLLYSPSDLGNFVACEHLTQLELAAMLGESTRPSFSNAYMDLIARKGEEHEKNFLDALRAEGHAVDEVGLGVDRDFALAICKSRRHVGRRAKIAIMPANQLAVLRGDKISFDKVGALIDRKLIRLQRMIRSIPARAAMANDQHLVTSVDQYCAPKRPPAGNEPSYISHATAKITTEARRPQRSQRS